MNGWAALIQQMFIALLLHKLKALDLTVKLGGKGYVFWGGREV